MVREMIFIRYGFTFRSVRVFNVNIACSLLVCLLGTNTALSYEIAPPKYNIVDRMGVNMATGQVQVSQTDLAIGGEQGLSHTVSRHSSEFFGGFNDNFKGLAASKIHLAGGDVSSQFGIVRVSGNGATEDFRYTLSGNTYIYTALNDPRNSLEFLSGTGLVFTQADGTKNIYAQAYRGGATITSYRPTNAATLRLNRIVYPTGLQVTINYKNSALVNDYPAVSSVRTNTGFQLKYQYVDDNRPLSSAKRNSTMEASMTANSLSWSRGNPKHIVALNNAYEHCDVSLSFCNTNQAWPTVTYQWPAGMPRAMAVGQSTFSITDPEGRTTYYHHTGIDKSLQLPNGTWLAGILPNTKSEPRITSIDSPDNSPVVYEYENRVLSGCTPSCEGGGLGFSLPRWFPNGYGILTDASHDSETQNYTLVQSANGSDTINASGGYKAINRTLHNNQLGTIREIDTFDLTVRREDTFYNRIRDIYNKRTGLYTEYEYDSRLNITAIKENDVGYFGSPNHEVTLSAASYPSACNTANRKYCNKATWVRDANGHQTDYTYHAASGMVASVTQPADKRGVRPQRRYYYVQKVPTHSGADHSPIWVLDKEEFCRNSSASNGNCSGNDETVIKYQYELKNLLLIGKAITAEGKTLRTCYEYDRFARKIGETQPNANLNSCS